MTATSVSLSATRYVASGPLMNVASYAAVGFAGSAPTAVAIVARAAA